MLTGFIVIWCDCRAEMVETVDATKSRKLHESRKRLFQQSHMRRFTKYVPAWA